MGSLPVHSERLAPKVPFQTAHAWARPLQAPLALGAGDRNRIRNLLFTKHLLCQLSYAGIDGKGSGTLFGKGIRGLARSRARHGPPPTAQREWITSTRHGIAVHESSLPLARGQWLPRFTGRQGLLGAPA